jgi:hypothetical protein
MIPDHLTVNILSPSRSHGRLNLSSAILPSWLCRLSALSVRAYVEPVAVGEALPEMPLFLEPGAHVLVPLEESYQSAFAAVPRRWRRVLERPD